VPAKSKVRQKSGDIRDEMAPAMADLKDAAADYAASARDAAVQAAETTRDWAAPRIEAAKEQAGPAIGAAVQTAQTKLSEDVMPAVAAAVTAAIAASEPFLEEAKSRGGTAVAALKGEAVAAPRRKGRGRWIMLLGIVAGAAAGWAIWKRRQRPEPWQQASPESVARPLAHDTAGAGPDEALADAGESPASPTTPENPLEAHPVDPEAVTVDPFAEIDLTAAETRAEESRS
jgi:hypothetical protein